MAHRFFAELEAKLRDEMLYFLERKLHLDFTRLLRVMPVERPYVDPETSWLEDFVEYLHVV